MKYKVCTRVVGVVFLMFTASPSLADCLSAACPSSCVSSSAGCCAEATCPSRPENIAAGKATKDEKQKSCCSQGGCDVAKPKPAKPRNAEKQVAIAVEVEKVNIPTLVPAPAIIAAVTVAPKAAAQSKAEAAPTAQSVALAQAVSQAATNLVAQDEGAVEQAPQPLQATNLSIADRINQVYGMALRNKGRVAVGMLMVAVLIYGRISGQVSGTVASAAVADFTQTGQVSAAEVQTAMSWMSPDTANTLASLFLVGAAAGAGALAYDKVQSNKKQAAQARK